MPFNVTFYTFSKKGNSTARPAAAGTTYACMGKAPLSIIAPRLQLKLADGAEDNPAAWNYAYIPSFSRYYRVKEWTNSGPLWEAALVVDALASWKTQIGAQSCYVYRSSSNYNGRIADAYYPTIARYRRLKIDLAKMWTIDGASASASQGGGLYVLGIIGNGITSYFGFTQAHLESFLSAIFSNTYYNSVLGAFGATEYPEAKVALNPLQYIASIRFYPCGFGVPTMAWALHYTHFVSSVPVGPVPVTCTAHAFTASGNYVDQTSYNTTYVDYAVDTTDFLHPQQQERGDFLQLAPFTKHEAFVPPWGLIDLNGADLIDANYLRMRITVDIRSGEGVLTLSALHGPKEIILARASSQVGIDCPLSAVVQAGEGNITRGLNLVEDILGVFTKGPSSLFGGGSTISNAVAGEIPHLFSAGTQASGANMAGDPYLLVTHRYAADDDLACRGRPLCSVRQLSAIPGYIMGDPDEISIPCTNDELAEIRAAVSKGFFYE